MNKGFLVNISIKIHPTDHISIGVQYSEEPNKISGALYHKVTTSWVKGLIGIEKVLDNPKSAILHYPLFIIIYLFFFENFFF